MADILCNNMHIIIYTFPDKKRVYFILCLLTCIAFTVTERVTRIRRKYLWVALSSVSNTWIDHIFWLLFFFSVKQAINKNTKEIPLSDITDMPGLTMFSGYPFFSASSRRLNLLEHTEDVSLWYRRRLPKFAQNMHYMLKTCRICKKKYAYCNQFA